ncbi:10068_t:CDS:2 [Paraglomus brasilianum]|uniref:10068_t:CDS:1 n=1 Tax=Paraglomus brasilianum TaxID=144538 RepID=A0A9N8WNF0_9GLOM|nr:10068_t:CDS:2 [Paraglomus brasilianum]
MAALKEENDPNIDIQSALQGVRADEMDGGVVDVFGNNSLPKKHIHAIVPKRTAFIWAVNVDESTIVNWSDIENIHEVITTDYDAEKSFMKNDSDLRNELKSMTTKETRRFAISYVCSKSTLGIS